MYKRYLWLCNFLYVNTVYYELDRYLCAQGYLSLIVLGSVVEITEVAWACIFVIPSLLVLSIFSFCWPLLYFLPQNLFFYNSHEMYFLHNVTKYLHDKGHTYDWSRKCPRKWKIICNGHEKWVSL